MVVAIQVVAIRVAAIKVVAGLRQHIRPAATLPQAFKAVADLSTSIPA
jgi:hypothetical protein